MIAAIVRFGKSSAFPARPFWPRMVGLAALLCFWFGGTICLAQGWSEWRSLGAPDSVRLESLVVGLNQDGRQEVFVRANEGTLWHIWQKYPNSGWSEWSAMVAPRARVKLQGEWAVWQNQDGRQELFARSQSGEIWHVWQKAPNSGWSGWKSLGSPPQLQLVSSPVAGRNQDGRQEVFALGSDRALWHVWQRAANEGWRKWKSLGLPATVQLTGSPVVGHNADGRLEVFVVGSDSALWHVWQTAANEAWGKWKRLGVPTGVAFVGNPALSQNADGRMELFLLAKDGSVWHRWQTYPNGGWSKWKSLGRPATSTLQSRPVLGRDKEGRLVLFAVGREGALWYVQQKAPNSGWRRWQSLDAPAGARLLPHLDVGHNQDGRLEVFALGADGALWHVWQEKEPTPY